MPLTNVSRHQIGKSITLKMENGSDEKGNSLYVNKTFSSIKKSATDNDIMNTAIVLEELQNKPVQDVIVQDRHILLIG